MLEHSQSSRLRIAWVEEWMSSVAFHVLPYLARKHDVYYVTAGDEIPKADFIRVIRGKRWRYMNVAGFELSRYVNRLYRDGHIDLAIVWSSIGFGLRRVPFIHFAAGSVYAQILFFASQTPFYRRIRFLPGFVHYVLPEMVCNKQALKVIVPSNALRRDLVRLHRLPEDKVVVLPHGVEVMHLALYQKKIREPRPKILFVGRLHPAKGIAAVLKEFVGRPDIDAELLIVGDGPDRESMEKIAAGDKRVKILGSVGRTELMSILQTTNVFVFPTFYEAFGLALTEAMASGHACVCYDLPVIREVLGNSGVTVPVGDSATLVKEVARLVNDPESIASYSARAHQRAGQFSWEDSQTSINQIIQDTVRELQNVQA
jgi:glycosyltransferase involved in cell wall biosynthesis